MELEGAVLERVRAYDTYSRWEKSEIGRDLRRLGLSYGEIMDLIPVKKSTLATWCRDIELTPEQIDAIKKRTGENARVPDTQWRRRAEIEAIRSRASERAVHLMVEPLWVAGVSLYWGGGSKTRNKLEVANSDPALLRVFIAYVRGYLEPSADFSLHLNLHADNDEERAREFWRSVLDLHGANFHKSFIKPDGTGHRKNHLEYGVCRVKVRRCADAWQTTMAWVEFLKSRLGPVSGPLYNRVGRVAGATGSATDS